MSHPHQITITLTIEAHEPSKQQKRSRLTYGGSSDCTILEYLQLLAESVKVLNIPLDKVAVELGEYRIPHHLKFEDILHGKK